jgi:hypothetical protein
MLPYLSFGISRGQLVHISKVSSGLTCDCICPVCHSQLIARKGNKTIHHFAHYRAGECIGSAQTALHMAAKEILEKSGMIYLPSLTCSLAEEDDDSITLYKSQKLGFDKVYLEKRIDRIVPDIFIIKNRHPLIVEIKVTHPLDVSKIQKIKSLNISALEIDLSEEDDYNTMEKLQKKIIYGLKNKKWVFNTKRWAFLNQIQNYCKKLRVYHRKVYECPIPRIDESKPYVDLIDDCFNCDFFIHTNGSKSAKQKHIKCVGHARNDIAILQASFHILQIPE